jgi:hypothetical protein
MMLLHVMGMLVLASTALALSSTAHIKPVSAVKGKKADDTHRHLTSNAHKETVALSHAHIPKTDADSNNVRPSVAARRLTGKARAEFEQLSSTARATAEGVLSHAHISEADADNVHFNAKGHLFFADPIPKHHANENLLKDEKEESADGDQRRRRRRSLSDAQPDRFLASGECGRTGGMGTVVVVEGGE